jgi:hypothetical protein
VTLRSARVAPACRPLAVGEHAGLGGGFVLAKLPDCDRVLYLENAARDT